MALTWEDLGAIACGSSTIKRQDSDRLWQLFGPLVEAEQRDQRFVIAQLGQSLDGRIATPSGHSHYINGEKALEHLHRLRARVDAVVVGASTIALDNPALTVRRVKGRNPARVVIDPHRRIDPKAKIFTSDGTQKYVIGPPTENDSDAVTCISNGTAKTYDTDWIVTELNKRGFKRLLIEGGATTVSRFIADGAIDRLHILTGPMIIGSGPSGLNLPAIETLEDAVRPHVATHILEGGDVVFDCDFTRKDPD